MHYTKTRHVGLHARALAPTLTAAGDLCVDLFTGRAQAAATAEELCRYADISRERLARHYPATNGLARDAQALLIFPCIMQLGLIAGGAYGEGVLIKGTNVAGYYRLVTLSWGLQAGAECFSQIVFLMNTDAVACVERLGELDVGVDLTPAPFEESICEKPRPSRSTAIAYRFVFDPQGVMVSLGFAATKISRIRPRSIEGPTGDAASSDS